MTELSSAVEVFVLGANEQDATWAPLPAALEFTLADPIATTLVLGGDDPDAVRWVFSFDLIYRASIGRSTVGVGDVRFSFDELDTQWVLLRLSSPDAFALLRMNAMHVKKFVLAVKAVLDAQPTVDLVAESLDQMISAILEGSA